MILVDTSVWVDHLRQGDAGLVALLRDAQVLGHPWVTGELALGRVTGRREILGLLRQLPQATAATDDEVLDLVDRRRQAGSGIGYIDAHLLAATLLSAGASLWTRDRRLADAAAGLGIAATTPSS